MCPDWSCQPGEATCRLTRSGHLCDCLETHVWLSLLILSRKRGHILGKYSVVNQVLGIWGQLLEKFCLASSRQQSDLLKSDSYRLVSWQVNEDKGLTSWADFCRWQVRVPLLYMVRPLSICAYKLSSAWHRTGAQLIYTK